MKVLAGSRNPVKIVATQEAFGRYFGPVDVIGIEVDSGVSVQPVNGETLAGARNRALALRQLNREQGLSAHFFVGIEGGMIQLHGTWFALGAMCVIDESGREGRGTSGLF